MGLAGRQSDLQLNGTPACPDSRGNEARGNQMNQTTRSRPWLSVMAILLSLAIPVYIPAQGGGGGGQGKGGGGRGGGAPATPAVPRAAAPIDLTGYWVSLVTADWLYRMVTPKVGDTTSVDQRQGGRRRHSDPQGEAGWASSAIRRGRDRARAAGHIGGRTITPSRSTLTRERKRACCTRRTRVGRCGIPGYSVAS
jgi:hypothetical protein